MKIKISSILIFISLIPLMIGDGIQYILKISSRNLAMLILLAVTILFVVVSIAMMLLGKIAVLILYGKKYLDAVYPLSILIWSTGFAIIGTARGIWIVAEAKEKVMLEMSNLWTKNYSTHSLLQ